jgi:hypothetical protein
MAAFPYSASRDASHALAPRRDGPAAPRSRALLAQVVRRPGRPSGLDDVGALGALRFP